MRNRERDLAGLHPASVVGAFLAGRADGSPAATDAEPAPARQSRSRRLAGALSRRRRTAAAARARGRLAS